MLPRSDQRYCPARCRGTAPLGAEVLPRSGCGCIPRSRCGGTPRSGCGGIPRSGCGGIPRSGCGGTPRSGCSGITRSGCGCIPCTGCGGIPRSGCSGIPCTGCGGTPRSGCSGILCSWCGGIPRSSVWVPLARVCRTHSLGWQIPTRPSGTYPPRRARRTGSKYAKIIQLYLGMAYELRKPAIQICFDIIYGLKLCPQSAAGRRDFVLQRKIWFTASSKFGWSV